MTEAILPDLKLVGTTASAGGRFGNVRITGEAKMSGGLYCRSLKCMGTVDLDGSLQAALLKLTGECHVHSDMKVSKIRAIGQIEVSGNLTGEQVKITGGLQASGNCEAESFQVRGAIELDGLLNADEVDIRLHGYSRAKEIGGGSITVKRSRVHWFNTVLSSRRERELTSDLIEGDTVHLEYTTASVVRGNRVTIGPGCRIGRVEYRDDLRIDKNASVKERMRR
ncbi:hypothetical protein E5161_18120 [Cohnella pontilimi]|uniref:Bactofilin n=1 Tax=Cohnella pontilimi TaxID=2564100 RepID=A0A4U0F793_9BACL|nr:hypothetical protein [Cohnella pontilimi]TJY39854.1 hypothetical protein E5161_18120 [Cohnella pontilimi]